MSRALPFAALSLAAACALAPSFAQAGEAECKAVLAAIDATAEAPAYRQTMKSEKDGLDLQGIVIGDTIYMQMAGKWNKVQLKPGGRKGMMSEMIGAGSLSECKAGADAKLDAGAMATLSASFAPPKGLESFGTKVQTLWVGKADGRIHRMESEGMVVTVEYGEIKPPIP